MNRPPAEADADLAATEAVDSEARDETDDADSGDGIHMSYRRFAAMIATSTVLMLVLMYLNTYAWDHVRWSETRVYMALLMGATMAVVMLAFMISMYRSTRTNIAIFAGAVVVFAGSLFLVRSQTTVQDTSYMAAMIPHHSIAIMTSERSELEDYRVCQLAVEIIEAQRREIDEMDWLIDDIDDNGPARSASEAAERPVPEFRGSAIRSCQ